MDTPHVVYLVSIVAGELEKYEDEFDGIPVEYYVPVGTGREKTLRAFEPTPEMLAFFSERTGVRYPYAKYSQACAVDFIFGGMENISATTQTAETLRDAWAQLEGDSYGLVAHEAAHQWYGDLLTCASWSHAWLNEGFATYWEKLWWEHAEGEEEFLYRMLGARDSYLEEDRNEYRRPIVQRSFSAPFDIFDSHLYPKGAWVLHMIRGVLGDEAFFKAVQHYTRKHQGQVVETIDLRRAIQEATGVNLERFFDQWLHHGGHPEFRVTRDWDPEQRILTLRIEQQQTVDDLTPLFTLPIRLIVETDAGNVERRVAIERASQDVTLQLESAPTLVRFDPDFQVLYELEMERSTGETLHALRKDPGIIGRIFAARDLAKSASADEAVAGLELAVRHDIQRGVRIEAAKALGALRGDAARDALVAALVDHDARVRKAVARALGEVRDADVAARELRALLDTERAYGVYAAAVLSLARIRAETAHDEARRALTLDSYQEQIRSAALEALAELDSDDARETLVAWSAYGRPSRARRTAVGALPRLGLQGRERDDVIRGLIDLLDDPDLFVRQQVMKTLAKLGADSAVDRLERSARSEADSRLRREARSALRSIRQGRPGDRTVDELAAEVERLREEIRSQSDRIEEIEKQAP